KKAARPGTDRGVSHAPEPAPDQLAGEGDLVEPLLPVSRDPGREHLRFPRGGRDLESGEPARDLDDAARAFEPVALAGVLPAGEKAPELRRGDRLDFTAQALEGVAMNSGEQPAIAPGLASLETAAKDRALRFQLEEEVFLGFRHPGRLPGPLTDHDRAERLETAAQDRLRILRRLDGAPAHLSVGTRDRQDAPGVAQLLEPCHPVRCSTSRNPSTSIASVRQSSIV